MSDKKSNIKWILLQLLTAKIAKSANGAAGAKVGWCHVFCLMHS